MTFFALIVTIIYLFLLRWITKPILYISIFLMFLMGCLVSLWCFLQVKKQPPNSTEWKTSIAGGVIAAIYITQYNNYITQYNTYITQYNNLADYRVG